MLISKDENFQTSSINTAYLILKIFKEKKETKLTIFEISKELKKYNLKHYRQFFCGLAFLFSVDIVDFNEPFITIISKKSLNDKNKKTLQFS